MNILGKTVGILLLITLTLQVTDLTCGGEGLSLNAPGMEGALQLGKSDLDSGNSTYFHSDILHLCSCPCHLSFTPSQSALFVAYLVIVLSSLTAYKLSLNKISIDILQPPKILI
jgi:hypothetical protein